MQPSAESDIISVKAGSRRARTDVLAVEEPLEIRLGYTDPRRGRRHKSLSITMRTPGRDRELAAGFLYCERIISAPEQVASIDDSADNLVRIELADEVNFDLARLERHFYTASSCGLCGKASLEALSMNGIEALRDNDFAIPQKALSQLGANLRKRQALFRDTGGCHGAAIFNETGQILSVREDVGRHNAMDKLIGSLLLKRELPLSGKGIIVSGRASFELMQKAAAAGCPMLAAVGAPSSLAVELAREFNIALVGFLSERGYNVYHDPALCS